MRFVSPASSTRRCAASWNSSACSTQVTRQPNGARELGGGTGMARGDVQHRRALPGAGVRQAANLFDARWVLYVVVALNDGESPGHGT
jgi:hypothetical protein